MANCTTVDQALDSMTPSLVGPRNTQFGAVTITEVLITWAQNYNVALKLRKSKVKY